MKNLILSLVFLLPLLAKADWANPKILCLEEILPQGLECLDLTQVKNPMVDFPLESTVEERHKWSNDFASDLKLCRNKEVIRREKLKPGSFTPLQVELAWMIVNGVENPQEKYLSIMDAAKKYSLPPQILIGALTQESLLANLGISPDGGNYSCGVAQLNISEWCQGMKTLTPQERAALGWPDLTCSSLASESVEPFYNLAVKNLGRRPEYQITAADFSKITIQDVGLESTPKKFEAISSFIKNCQNVHYSIPFKAYNLRSLFNNFVPASLRKAEIYSGNTFSRNCLEKYPSSYYPLHTGWLLAVAIYNAGPIQTKLLEHYYQVKNDQFPSMNPLNLIDALHWGGKVKGSRVYFTGQNGQTYSQLWYKSCVVQRHVSRVIQHVTQPGLTIARSLEKEACGRGKVPVYRQNSSGINLTNL